ncbi:MAG: SDR family oxidoreductase [Opitutaceae bacterium]|jgi:NAD(P)-dependent dehydrogenase (short-subunit alcohol dehydrogenase family)|nr:SDR family oxidoreductase [Opitutaceae bacterium]
MKSTKTNINETRPEQGGFASRVAVITGGAQGIGEGIVLAFARAGADIAFTYLGASPQSRAKARRTAAAARRLGRRVVFDAVDATSEQAAEAFMGRVLSELGRVDILVNNVGGAGTVPEGGFAALPLDYWRRQFDKNFFSAVMYSQLAVRDMLPRRDGSIINIGSIHTAKVFNTKFVPYSCAKQAMNQLTRDLAVELAPCNIRVNCIAPGLIKTALTKWRYDAAWWADVNGRIPMRRPGSPAEIGRVALFLASRQSSYLTGQIIYVDGGGADGGWKL